jgi:hypothetical protein
MNPLDLLFGHVANAVQQHADPNTPGPSYDANPVLGALSGMFGNYAQQNGQQFSGYNPGQQYQNQGSNMGSMLGGLGGLLGGGGIGSALGGMLGGGGGQQSQGGQFGNVMSSSQDPYGDPADQGGSGQFGNVRSSSQDPYGDPADQGR